MSHMIDKTESSRIAPRPRLRSRGLLVGLVMAISIPAAAQDEGFDPDESEGEEEGEGEGSGGDRSPQLVLRGYSGSLCPENSADFSSSGDGGITFTLSEDPEISTEDVQSSCHLDIDLIVPANARFRNPRLCPSIYGVIAPEGLQTASQIRFDYNIPGGGESFTETIEPVGDDFSKSFCRMVNMTTPECTDPTQPTTLNFTIDISTRVRPGAYLQLQALDGEFAEMFGVQWTTCSGGF